MIKFTNTEQFPHDRVIIDTDHLRIILLDERYLQGSIGYTHHYLDLKQLVKIQLIYEFPDYERRRQEAAKKTREKRAGNAVLGAIAGGIIDSAIGDDSILDGVLIGAAAGAVLTGVEKIDLKEQAEHRVNLLFKDGTSCEVIVDAAGMSELLRAEHALSAVTASPEPADPIGEIPLSSKQIEIAALAAKNNYVSSQRRVSHLLNSLGFMCAVLILLSIMLHFGIKMVNNFSDMLEGINVDQSNIANLKSLFYPYQGYMLMASIAILAMAWVSRKKENKSIEQGLISGQGLPENVTNNSILE